MYRVSLWWTQSRKAGEGRSEGFRGVVLLYLLGGDEKQLPSPQLFPALFSSYPTPSLSKTLLLYCLPALPGSYGVFQQLCLRPRSWQTTKWAVIGQRPALLMIPLDPHLCVLSLIISQLVWHGLWPKPSVHPFIPPFLSSRLAVHLFLMAVCTWAPGPAASQTRSDSP